MSRPLLAVANRVKRMNNSKGPQDQESNNLNFIFKKVRGIQQDVYGKPFQNYYFILLLLF